MSDKETIELIYNYAFSMMHHGKSRREVEADLIEKG